MTAEHGGFNPESVQREQLVSSLRQEVKTAGFFDASIVKTEKEKNESGKKIVESLKINKNSVAIDSVEELLQMQNDPSLGDKSKENIDERMGCLAEAIYREMAESSNDEIKKDLLAGSYSIEKRLPENMSGLGDAVVNKFTGNQEIRGIMEQVDYIKNDPSLNVETFLLEQVQEAKIALSAVKIDFRDKREMSAKMMELKYLSDLEKSLLPEPTQIVDREEKAKRRTPKPYVVKGEDGQDIFEGGYGPDFATFTNKVLFGTRTDLRDSMPPLWYKDFKKELGPEKGRMEQIKYGIIASLADFSGSKLALKDGDLDTLANKARPAMTKEEFRLLYEINNETGSGLPGFKEALEVFVQDLFDFNEDGNGLLSIKNTDENKNKFVNFYDHEVEMADQLFKNKGLFKDKKPEAIKTPEEAKLAVATAWNFLFVGDIVESADQTRLLNPGKAYGDKVAAMFHPEAKMFRKLKLTGVGGKFADPEKDKSGEKEAYGGAYGEWLYNSLTDNPDLKKEILSGKKHIFPSRLGMSHAEMFPVVALENGRPKKTSMAEALFKGEMIVTSPKQLTSIPENISIPDVTYQDDQVFIKYRDIYQSAYGTFNQLLGKTKIEKGNEDKWIEDFKDRAALIRQNVNPVTNEYLDYVDDPEFLKIIIANTVGVKTEWMSGLFLNLVDNPALYDVYVDNILTTPDFIVKDRKETIKKLKKDFNAEGYFSSKAAIRKAKSEFAKMNTKRRNG